MLQPHHIKFCCCGFCVQNGVASPKPNWLLNPELSFSLDWWSIKDREPNLPWYLTHSWGGKAIDVRVAVVISTVIGIGMLRSLHSNNYPLSKFETLNDADEEG